MKDIIGVEDMDFYKIWIFNFVNWCVHFKHNVKEDRNINLGTQ